MIEKSLVDCLLPAIQEFWSGSISVTVDGRLFGSIVIVGGRVAWASCKDQSETLGIFLWRLGRITREQFNKVQEIFDASGGKKMLSVILEESGFMSRQVLRRCIMLHTRSALTKLLSERNAKAMMVDGEPKTDERLLFGPEEVLPLDLSVDLTSEWSGLNNTWARGWYIRSSENEILENFIDLSGYMASAIISFDGDVVTGHVSDSSVDLPILAVNVAAMLESSSRAIKCTGLRLIDHIMIDCAEGGLTARWLDEDQRYLVFVLTGAEGKISLVRYSINVATPALKAWISEFEAGDMEYVNETSPFQPIKRIEPKLEPLFVSDETQDQKKLRIHPSEPDKEDPGDIFTNTSVIPEDADSFSFVRTFSQSELTGTNVFSTRRVKKEY